MTRDLTRPVSVLFGAVAFFAAYAIVRSVSAKPPAPPGMVWIPGGEFEMGTDADLGRPEEKPARGGLAGKPYAWGDAPFSDDRPQANIWRGEFRWKNTARDGFERTPRRRP